MKVEYIDGDGSEVPVANLAAAAGALYEAASAVLYARDIPGMADMVLAEGSPYLAALRNACALAEQGAPRADMAGK